MDALLSNSALRHVYLTGIEMGDEGPRHIPDALQSNSTLQVLGINNNQFGGEGALHITNALGKNSALLHLILGGSSGCTLFHIAFDFPNCSRKHRGDLMFRRQSDWG
eukprot:GGOE01042152.1.p1 GENE.GGOE01042152.1~~GGOE01042152.1.p1  ORF type:complete len:107 (-),score=15.27 GGOE01042152.1:28-348(-)